MLARIRKAARGILSLKEDYPKRVLEGAALFNRMLRIGVLKKEQQN
jgi:hypothetical protein